MCCGGPGSGPVFAAQIDFGAGYAVSHDSNITRSETDPRSEYTEQLFGGLVYNERSAELTARLVAQVEKRRFVHNVYPDDNGFFLDGLGVWTISPSFFTWTFQDVYRELNTSVRDPATPATMQKTNSFSTGPEFSFRWDAANTPVIGARYGQFRVHGGGEGDSDRYTAYGQWLRQISTPSVLSLNFQATRIHFDPPALYTDISRWDGFFRFDFSEPTVRQTVDVGSTVLQQYGGERFRGRLFRYFGQWARTSETALRILLADQISDTYSDTIQDFSIPTLPSIRGEVAAVPLSTGNFFQPDIYHSRRADLTYESQGGFLGYLVQGYLRSVDFATLPQDYSEKGGRISGSLQFSIEAQAYAFTRYSKRVFSSNHEEDTDRETAAGLLYQLGRSTSLRVEGGRLERQSNVPLQSYVDRRGTLVLGYSTGAPYTPQSRR